MTTSLILGIESSCDETSAAVVRNGAHVLSNVVASQLIHADYGGVVPELASREHLRNIVPVVTEALTRANVTLAQLDAIAVTEGPGLAGTLLVGITFAKALALAANKPLIAVNHLEGHIHAVLMDAPLPAASPLLALVVSGGHTHLYLATLTPQNTYTYRNIGKTLDDAAGEAFDKVAKLLGLPYPGGPWMDALAAHGTADSNLFPFTQIKQKANGHIAPKLSREAGFADVSRSAIEAGQANHLYPPRETGGAVGFSPRNITPQEARALALAPRRFDLSFSGLKTAVRRYVESHAMQPAIATREEAFRTTNLATAKLTPENIAAALAHFDPETLNLIASFQHAVIKNLARATFDAAAHFDARALLISGGVSANTSLRATFTTLAAKQNLPIAFPTITLATDNAAMIAAAAHPKLLTQTFAPDTLEPTPQLRLG